MKHFVELLLLRNEQGQCCAGIVPIGKAYSGDLALVDGELYRVECTSWIEPAGDPFTIVSSNCELKYVDMVMHEAYCKEELHVEIGNP